MSENIKIIEGDLLSSDANVITHSCNNRGAMNSGVAKQIREKYPTVYNTYYSTFKKEGLNLGLAQFVIIDKDKYICNLIGQDGYGYDGKQYTNYEAFKTGLYGIRNFMIENNYKKVAFPYNIGCCRGGGKWEEIYKLIENVFSDTVALAWDLQVEIYKLDLG